MVTEIVTAYIAAGGAFVVSIFQHVSQKRKEKSDEKTDIRKQLQTLWEKSEDYRAKAEADRRQAEEDRRKCEERYMALQHEHLQCQEGLAEVRGRLRNLESKSEPPPASKPEENQ